MKNYKIRLVTENILADLVTPVGIYLQARSKYKKSLLLESSDYRGHENSFSFICIDPVAMFQVDRWRVAEEYPDGSRLKEIKVWLMVYLDIPLTMQFNISRQSS